MPTEHNSKCLQVQVRQETYAWLESIAGEHGIGGALDLMAEIHRLIEKAADPLGVENKYLTLLMHYGINTKQRGSKRAAAP